MGTSFARLMAKRMVAVPAKASFSSFCGSTYIWKGGWETKLVKPATVPQSAGRPAGRASVAPRCRTQALRQ